MSVVLRYHTYLPGIEPPTLARGLDRSGLSDSGQNRLRVEHCPAVLDAARLGVLLRSAASHSFFDDGDHHVWVYRTGEGEGRIFDPCLVGSNEAETGYYKIATGLCIHTGSTSWLVTPPLDPRIRLAGWLPSWGYLRPGFQGPLFVVMRPTGEARLTAGTVIGQLVPLAPGEVEVVESAFNHDVRWQPDHHLVDGSQTPLCLQQRELEESLRSGNGVITRAHGEL